MKVNFYHGYDGGNNEEQYGEPEVDNRTQPIIRKGGEPFKSCYDLEWCYHVCHVIDPARSLAIPVLNLMDWKSTGISWAVCDRLYVLIPDMGISRRKLSREDIVAFWTMFPGAVAEALSESVANDESLLEKYSDVVRVLNNPFFYKDRNASEHRLVEIAEDNGLRFALDRISVIPSPEVLAREIALLNYGGRNPQNVESAQSNIALSIAETMEDWGLKPTVRLEEAAQHKSRSEST